MGGVKDAQLDITEERKLTKDGRTEGRHRDRPALQWWLALEGRRKNVLISCQQKNPPLALPLHFHFQNTIC